MNYKNLTISFLIAAAFLGVSSVSFAEEKTIAPDMASTFKKVEDAYDKHGKNFITNVWTWTETLRIKIHDSVKVSYDKKKADQVATEETMKKEQKDVVDLVLGEEKASIVHGASDRVHPEQVFHSAAVWVLGVLVVWSGSILLFYGSIVLVILLCLWSVWKKFRGDE
jgi:phosphotransferase system IIB component